MKNKNIDFKDMYNYVLNYYLLPEEAYYFLKMEGADENLVPKRNGDIEYLNTSINFIKAMNNQNKLDELPETFLERLNELSNKSLINLLNICYFPLNIKNKDYLNCFKEFYDFFKNPNIDYGEHKYEVIKNYLNDNSNLSVFFKTVMAIDMNILSNDASTLESMLEQANIKDIENYFINKKINIDRFNKRVFIQQLKYIKNIYLNDKNKTL